MQVRKSILWVIGIAIVMLAATSIASAGPFSAVVVYGDSLSDNGNLYAITSQYGFPTPASPPYYQGRYSNGPVAAEQLAGRLGAPLFDFAFGGATSGVGNYGDGGTQTAPGAFGLPGMAVEFAASANLIHTPGVTKNSLFFLWGGANDFFTGDDPAAAAQNIDNYASSLLSLGATHVVVAGIPDLGSTPELQGMTAATLYSLAFNADLKAGLPQGAIYFDTFAMLNAMINNPAAYGFTNVTTPCLSGLTACADPNDYLFWDGIHPTTAADAFLAKDLETVVTPEPSMFLLLGTGISGLMLMIRRASA